MEKLLIKFILVALFLVNTTNANEVTYIKSSNKDNSRFIIKYYDGIKKNETIRIYNKEEKLKAIAKVIKCNTKYCLAKVSKRSKGFIVSAKSKFIIKNGSSTKKVAKSDPIKKTSNPEIKKNTEGKKAIFFSIGGAPLSYGYKLGYQDCSLIDKYCFEGSAGLSSATIGSVGVSGIYGGVGATRHVYDFGSVKSFIHADLGMMMANLDFSSVSTNNYEVSESIFFLSTSYRLLYDIGKKISIFGGLGYSLNTFSESYINGADKYNISFNSSLIIIDFGIAYKF